MRLDGPQRPDVDQVLCGLKDFQRDTVDYVFRRLYTDSDSVSRFLIADEVGLGKTLVARGIIAKAVDLLWDTVPRIDVIYICSNQAIAQQNIDRLNITAERQFQFASRATLLPVTLEELKGNKLNFVSLTPGTSFDLRSKSGWKHERAVLFALLKEHWNVPEATLSNILRGDVRKDRWHEHLEWFDQERASALDPELAQAFYDSLDQMPELRERYDRVATLVDPRRKHLTLEMRRARNELIGRLRRLLARSSLFALEPDLVILDEFQRFKYLLDPEGDIAGLAQELFDFPDAKVLLLSATPYKMYTLQAEADEDHYEDFLHTVGFLLQDRPDAKEQLEAAIEQYRTALMHLDRNEHDKLRSAKQAIEKTLRKVMVRTERLAASTDRNGMLVEHLTAQDQVYPDDLEGFIHLDRIARKLEAGDQVEYWKSAAYLLNLMDDYDLKRKFKRALEDAESDEIGILVQRAQHQLLDWQTIQQYQSIDPGNARLRALWQETLDTRNWQLLWMPASLPYYRPLGPFQDIEPPGYTKTLIFSAWRLVPKTIAMLMSYEAERQMVAGTEPDYEYSNLTRRRRPLLTFTRSQDRLTGMPVFCLIYPCLTLARAVDPLRLAQRLAKSGVASADNVFQAAKAEIKGLLDAATTAIQIEEPGSVDERWYWASLALLDRYHNAQPVGAWLDTDQDDLMWHSVQDAETETQEDEEGGSRFADHVALFSDYFHTPQPLGTQPSDLLDVLTRVALSGPAVASLRAMLRMTQPNRTAQWVAFLMSAARTGVGFRSLFNQPEAIALLQGLHPEPVYWQAALTYCFEGNLQAVLDEYYHVLFESLGLVGHDPGESTVKLADTVQSALSLRAPTLRFDEIKLPHDQRPTIENRGLRCRYALRFGDEKSADYDGRTRDVDVRIAFNSPFRPFVLATTSIGQEGLDFHQYCHRVVHWNLPSNPVDLEQREGRVHRYKCHVIRRNLALAYGLATITSDADLPDPWRRLFQQAVKDRPPEANDLVPFWIYEADELEDRAFKIEREIPVFPLSREISRMKQLKMSLVAYRSVIGQPRQQELLAFLAARLGQDQIRELVSNSVIDLSPPKP